MKFPIHLLFALAILFHSCGNGDSAESGASAADIVKTEKQVVDDAHNSQNALDWTGTYSGVLPCDDCDELQAEITLEENGRFSRKLVYKGKSNTPLLSSGIFEWNDAGSEITLKSFKGNGQVYKVGENRLIYQVPEGGTGEYILSKVVEKADEPV
jgi:uncharacterized lipoprotein NlpE involved in copper resistance